MMLEHIQKWMESGKSMPVCKLVGMSVDEVETNLARCSMIAAEQHWNPFGTVHGGILCDLTDLAMGMAFMTTLQPGQGLATIELKINYFRPARTGKLSAEAKVLHRGRSTGFVECTVTDEAGKLIVKATSTCMVVNDERAQVWNQKES
jgi:uncharacterized protein (TIGR00369 family)